MMIQDVKVAVGIGKKKLPLMALEVEMNDQWLQESDGRDGWRRDCVGE